VFFDVSAIAGGEDFMQRIASEIAKSDAALVFIGNKWVEKSGPEGRPRIFHSDDYVRAEVSAALSRPVLVLPVLVGGAHMPRPEQLPENIRAITTKSALPLRHETFDDDTENIVAAVLGLSAAERAWEDKPTLGAKAAYAIGGAIAASLLVLLVGLLHFWVMGRPLSASIGGPLTTLLLLAAALAGALIGWRYKARNPVLR
jgi:TIR domain